MPYWAAQQGRPAGQKEEPGHFLNARTWSHFGIQFHMPTLS